MFIVVVAYRRAHTDLNTHHRSHESQRASPARPVCLCLFLWFFFPFVLNKHILFLLFYCLFVCFVLFFVAFSFSCLLSVLFCLFSFLFLLSCPLCLMVLLGFVGLSLDSSFVRVHSEFLNSYAFIDVLLMLCFIHFSALFRVLHAALRYLQCLQVHLRFTMSRIFRSAVMTSFPM